MILDGGPCSIGVESTVLDLTGPLPVLLRPGGVTREDLAEILGTVETPPADAGAAAPRSPGRLPSHYAPDLPVRLDATEARPGEALLAFGPEAPPGFAKILFLSRSGDLAEAAANLFAMLRASRPPGIFRDCGDADPGAGSRPGNQRPAAPRRRAALRRSTSARASPTRRRSRERPAAGA